MTNNPRTDESAKNGGATLPPLSFEHTPDPELTFLAAQSAYNHGVQTVFGKPGKGSYANLETKVLTLDPLHCTTRPAARFISIHEGGHIAHTATLSELGKTPEQIRRYSGMIGFHPLRNVIEDGAINDFNALRFRRLAGDTLESYPRTGKGEEIGFIDLPESRTISALLGRPALFSQALAGLLIDWSEMRHEYGFVPTADTLMKTPRLGPPIIDPRLLDFFDNTLLSSRLCIGLIPSVEQAVPEARFAYSAARLEMMEQKIYPHLLKLVNADLRELTAAINIRLGCLDSLATPNGTHSSKEAYREAEMVLAALEDALRNLLGSLADKSSNERGSAREAVSEKHSKDINSENEARQRAEAAQRRRLNNEQIISSLSPFDQEYHAIAHLIEPAYNRLCDIFDPKKRFSWRTNLPSGTHYNPIGILRFEATGEGYDTMHMRRQRPIEIDLLTGVLLDRSASMSIDSKYVYARRALIFLRLLYERLDLPTVVTWYADHVGTILTPEDSLADLSAQKRLMARAIFRKEGNQDGKGINYLASKMRYFDNQQRVAIVLTDAKVCDPKGLQKALMRLSQQNIPVLHFGLGKDTADNQGYFKYSWGNLDVLDDGPDGFMRKFCEVITNLATGALGQTIGDTGELSWLNNKK